jgi:DNA end-binding protein Ku
MKTLWKGYIILGQLGIPVHLYAATKDSSIRLIQPYETDLSPGERPLSCKEEHVEIPYSEIVKGAEIEPGKYVTFTDKELEQSPETHQKTIVIAQFCDLSQIDYSYIEKPYYTTVASGGQRGYALLREGLARIKKIAIGQFFFYGNEYLAAIAVEEDILMLHRLRFADELVPRTDIKTPALPGSNPSEIDMMSTIIERHSGPVYMRDYHNEYTEHLRLVYERKARRLTLPRPERPSPGAAPEEDIPATLLQIMGHGVKLVPANASESSV